jgi:UPF0755 protein
MKKLTTVVIILVIIALAAFLFYKEGSLAVNKKDTSSKLFVVEPGESLDTIINHLASNDLIRNRVVFYLIVKQMNIETKIQAGDFRISPSMDARAIAEELTHGTLDIWVTIPEGLRKEEIAEIISEKFAIPESEFNALAKEGYLYPDTYLIPKSPNAQKIIDILTKTFDEKFTDEMKAKMQKKGMTINQVVTLASILEREAFGDSDRQQIANILYRRWQEDYPLQVDATVQYVLGYQADEKRWWKKSLTLNDLKIKSPYNTYVVTGLPPGPIASPGIAAMQAVLNADANTPYFFYIHDSKGVTHYAKTSEEHEANIQKYLR